MENKDEKWLREEKYGGEASAEYESDRARLLADEPLAYVIGTIPFLGLTVHLDSKPLIPRPETEWWTEKLIAHLREPRADMSRPVRVLDLCAGSGAIGCSILAEVQGAEVTFAEIDAAHMPTIQKNIEVNTLDASRATLVTGDLFAPLAGERFDIIATNPPYIPEGRELDASVAQYEPALALYGGADGLALIRRIITEARVHLMPHGELWMEVDETHAEGARDLVSRTFSRATLIPDQYGRARLIVGYL